MPGIDPALGLVGLFLRAEELTEEQELEVIELMRLGFNGGPHWFDYDVDPVDHLRWKYRDSPDPGQFFFFLRNSEIVQVVGTIRRRVRLGGQPQTINDGGDMVLHPDLQGRGVDRIASAYRGENPRPRLGLQLRVLTHPAHLWRARKDPNWRSIGNPVRFFARPLDLSRLVELETGQGGNGSSRTARSMRSRWKGRLASSATLRKLDWRRRQVLNRLQHRSSSTLDGHVTIRTLTHFDDRFDAFFEEVAATFDYIRVRDTAYLNWRYTDPRGGAFEVRVAEDDGAVVGYAAISAQAGYIADLLVLPSREDVVRALVADATELAQHAGAPMVQTWLTERHPYRSALHDVGLVMGRRGQSPLVTANPIEATDEEMEPFHDPNVRIHFMPADTDHV